MIPIHGPMSIESQFGWVLLSRSTREVRGKSALAGSDPNLGLAGISGRNPPGKGRLLAVEGLVRVRPAYPCAWPTLLRCVSTVADSFPSSIIDHREPRIIRPTQGSFGVGLVRIIDHAPPYYLYVILLFLYPTRRSTRRFPVDNSKGAYPRPIRCASRPGASRLFQWGKAPHPQRQKLHKGEKARQVPRSSLPIGHRPSSRCRTHGQGRHQEKVAATRVSR